MLNSKFVKVRWVSMNRKHYESKGYKFTNWNDEFEVNTDDLSPTSGVKVDVVCDYCSIIFQQTYNHYIRSIKNTGTSVCKNCRATKISKTKSKQDAPKVLKRFNDWCLRKSYEPVTNINNYTNCRYLQYICSKHGLQTISSGNMDCDCGCNLCGNEKNGYNQALKKEVVKKIIESKNNNILLNPEDYICNSYKNLKIQCGSCNNIFISSLINIQQGKGHCYKCGSLYQVKKRTYKPDIVENMVNNINNNILLNKEDYINNHTKNLKILCGLCQNNIFTVTLASYVTGKTKCDYCSSQISNGELEIENFLKPYNIEYEREKRFNECKDKRRLPFDFYLPEYRCCIEFDGEQHYIPVSRFDKNGKELAKTQLHDRIKNKYCIYSGIKLIRIPYFERGNIEKILLEDLGFISTNFPKMFPKYRINNYNI